MANVIRLRATLEYIEADPDLWDQGSWEDCFAAWAVYLAGIWVSPSLWARVGDRSVRVWDAAAEVLDLTGNQARALFAPDVTLDGLRALVDAIDGSVHRPRHAKRQRHDRRLRLVG